MSTMYLTPSRRTRLRACLVATAVFTAGTGAAGWLAPSPAAAQQIVYDPRAHAQGALQAARQLESLVNEARQLANEARMLATSPYSHLVETSSTLAEMAELAATVKGLASEIGALERQFAELYPEDLSGLSAGALAAAAPARNRAARRTAEDLARTAADLERLGRGRERRLGGALAASEAASGQTAAVQSSTQVLAVLAEELAAVRLLMLAQARFAAEAGARAAGDRAAAAEARRRFWERDARIPDRPGFDPLARARD
ncbi:conjugal transfer protein TrbJ [Brevundimonas naejangsanensis]|uniref:conjugal transfer protein TrbJ n=1 Tax=Brevundimonas naejangsanensis TaxID=588932 RepID=UPI001FC830F1|nr:conjugal transfer protein TrbJ [Brevundimonas naejangsanensis]